MRPAVRISQEQVDAVNAANRTPRRLVRLLLLVLVGCGLIGGTRVYLRYFAKYRFWVPPPAGSGPAGPSVPREPFQGVWTKAPVVLLGVGDSVTAGFGADSGLSYFERLLENPPDEFDDVQGICLRAVLPNLTAMNISVSGSTSIEHWDTQVSTLKTFPPDATGFVVMTTGGNDLIHWYGRGEPKEGAMYGATFEQAQPWIENFRARLDTMLERIGASFPGGCHIFLANIYDPSDGVGDPTAAGLPPWPDLLAIHEAYNAAIADATERHEDVHLVDIRSLFLGHGVYCVQWWREHYDPEDPHYWYYVNLEDPNNRGYDALRRLFLNEIADVMAPRPGVPGPIPARHHASGVATKSEIRSTKFETNSNDPNPNDQNVFAESNSDVQPRTGCPCPAPKPGADMQPRMGRPDASPGWSEARAEPWVTQPSSAHSPRTGAQELARMPGAII